VTLRSKRGMILACAALLLALFVVRPGAGRLRTRIANSIGMALQRQVEISRVHVRLLPQPGFDLEGFVVHDDPAFGAEPVLRAPEVSAFLRLSSLLRGRLEISRLTLSEPSLNLVHRSDGHWNIESFLQRTASIAVAPTSKGRSESRPAFPYIEADRGRINFKVGPEKKPFAVTDAKYSVWQESENTWGLRLKGQPIRTDFNLSDTGQFSMDGTWQRAASLHETPVKFNVQWDGAQLGQLTKLVSGADGGWRGALRVDLAVEGSPADLQLRTDAALDDFRRYDITDTRSLRLKTHCEGHYNSSEHSLHQILCETPVGDGTVTLRGDASDLYGAREFALQLAVDSVPVDSVLTVVRRAKKNLPDDVRATGTIDAVLDAHHSDTDNSVLLEGSGHTNNFHLLSTSAKADLFVDVLPFSLEGPSQSNPVKKVHGREPVAVSQGPRLIFGAIPIKLGRSIPVTLQGWIERTGYSFSMKGESELPRLLAAARLCGIPAVRPVVTGFARIDLQIAGTWQGFATPVTTGTAELHSVRAEVRGVNGPLEIGSARISLAESAARVDGLSASFVGTKWNGSLSIPRPCASAATCTMNFDLHADEISTDRLNAWLNPNASQPWYRFALAPNSGGHSFLTAITASGTFTANRALIRNLEANRVSARLLLDQGKMRVWELTADMLGGKHRGDWRADFTVKPPSYEGSGSMEAVALDELADAMHDNWIVGTASAKYQLELAGFSFAELAESAKGSLRFDMRDGALPHIMVSAAPLRVRHFTGVLAAKDNNIELQDSTLEAPTANYAVSGKASLNRKLDFKLVSEGATGFSVTGTLAEPRVVPVRRPETEAALKP